MYSQDDVLNNNVKANRKDWDIMILNKQNTSGIMNNSVIMKTSANMNNSAIMNEKESLDNSNCRAVAVVAKPIFIEDYLSSASVC